MTRRRRAREARSAEKRAPQPAAQPGAQPAPQPAAPPGGGRASVWAGLPTGVTLVTSAQEAELLADHLLDPERVRPVVVVTRSAGHPVAHLDVAELADNLRGLAEVWEMPTGAISWAYSRRLPPRCDVYGGAARVYPPGLTWTQDPFSIPLTFVFGPEQGPAAVAQLTTDALRAVRAGVRSSEAGPHAVEARGVVKGVLPGRGLVALEGEHGLATIWTDLLADGVAGDSLLVKGMAVTGRLDRETRRLDVSAMRVAAADAVAGYAVGSVVLGLTRVVEPSLCVVELFPGLPVAVEADDVVRTARRLDLRALITEGEVVVARVLERGAEADEWRISLVEVGADDVPLPAPGVLRGGPPWLLPPASAEDALAAVVEPGGSTPPPQPVQQTAPPAPTGRPESASAALSEQLLDLVRERDALREQLREEQARAKEDRGRLQALRTAARHAQRNAEALRAEVVELRNELGRSAGDGALFDDPLEQLRFEVRLAWARRIPAAQKGELPLRSWSVGPEFLATMDAVGGVSRTKVVNVIVEVLTGLAAELDARELHQLRTGDGGADPVRVRADGATCWRVALQVRTPSARRLHYWQLRDGSIELSSIRLHDDVRP